MRMVERLAYDDECGFASMIRYINIEIRKWFARQMRAGLGERKTLDVDVLIERIAGDEDEDEDEVKRHGRVEFVELELAW